MSRDRVLIYLAALLTCRLFMVDAAAAGKADSWLSWATVALDLVQMSVLAALLMRKKGKSTEEPK